MKETVEMLLAARESAPERLRGLDFDGWMFGMIVNALAPVEREIVLWLMSDINPMDAARLAAVTGSTHYRVGAALTARGTGDEGDFAFERAGQKFQSSSSVTTALPMT